MKSGARKDEPHFDGGASLLHMGITIFGSRELRCWPSTAGPGGQLLQQSPGSIYVGNMCAIEHQVAHSDDAFGLYQPPAGSGQGLEIAVMMRTDVFSQTRGRKMKGKPTPTDVFDLVNPVIAQYLATVPLTLPDFASVAGAASAPEHVALDAEEAGPRRQKKPKVK